MGTDDRSALEALWRNRVKDARLRLDFARSYMQEIKQDFASGDLSGPMERYAIQKALRTETVALAEYARILALFNDLVIHGKVPKEDHPPRHATAGEGE